MKIIWAFPHFIQLLLIITAEKSHESSEEIFKSEMNHPFGNPENILKFGSEGRFIVDDNALEKIFLNEDVKDRKVVVVSIIGAYRKGKSFLLDYALRYMYGNYKSIAYPNNPLNNTQNWMGEPDEPLKGFSWKAGVKRDTTGIIMWSDIFLYEKDGKKLAIVLMDTQGLFDTTTSPTDNSRIFALGTLASSVQIFNLNDVIQEDQLEYLQLATEFSQFALKKNNNRKNRRKTLNIKPFQNLIFLMRDWQNKQDYEYGEVGGALYLAKVLTDRINQPEALREVRTYITSSFEKLKCFLMPHPGLTVTSDSTYKGQRSGLSKIFEEYLEIFLEFILKSKNLVTKKVLGIEVSGSDFMKYLKAYIEVFESDDIPKVETLHGITVRKLYEILISESFEEYKSHLKNPNYSSSTFINDINFNGNESIKTAMESFKKKRKLGVSSDEQKFKNQLSTLLEMHFTEWKLHHIKIFKELEAIEENHRKEIAEKKKLSQQRIREIEEQHENQTKELKATMQQEELNLIEKLKTYELESKRNINKLKQEYEAQKLEFQRSNAMFLNHLSKQNSELKNKSMEIQKQIEQQMLELETAMSTRQKQLEKSIAERRDRELEVLRNVAKQERYELKQIYEQQENSKKAELEVALFEKRLQLEEKRIRDEAEAEKKRGYEVLIAGLEKDKRNLQKIILDLYKNPR